MANEQSLQIELVNADEVYRGPYLKGHVWEISNHPDNAGNVYVGRQDPAVSSTTGYYLGENNVLVLEIPDLNDLYFISDNAGDRVTIIRAV